MIAVSKSEYEIEKAPALVHRHASISSCQCIGFLKEFLFVCSSMMVLFMYALFTTSLTYSTQWHLLEMRLLLQLSSVPYNEI